MEEKAVEIFAALGHEVRLRLFRALVPAGPAGLTPGALARDQGLPLSTLSHHLATLERAGLLANRREGRNLLYSIDAATVRGLISFLIADCCNGRPDLCMPLRDEAERAL